MQEWPAHQFTRHFTSFSAGSPHPWKPLSSRKKKVWLVPRLHIVATLLSCLINWFIYCGPHSVNTVAIEPSFSPLFLLYPIVRIHVLDSAYWYNAQDWQRLLNISSWFWHCLISISSLLSEMGITLVFLSRKAVNTGTDLLTVYWMARERVRLPAKWLHNR